VSTCGDICETFCSVTLAVNNASHLCCRMFTVEIWTGTPTVLSEGFRTFCWSFQSISGIVPQIRPRPPPSSTTLSSLRPFIALVPEVPTVCTSSDQHNQVVTLWCIPISGSAMLNFRDTFNTNLVPTFSECLHYSHIPSHFPVLPTTFLR
jgi:hypothetical protein